MTEGSFRFMTRWILFRMGEYRITSNLYFGELIRRLKVLFINNNKIGAEGGVLWMEPFSLYKKKIEYNFYFTAINEIVSIHYTVWIVLCYCSHASPGTCISLWIVRFRRWQVLSSLGKQHFPIDCLDCLSPVWDRMYNLWHTHFNLALIKCSKKYIFVNSIYYSGVLIISKASISLKEKWIQKAFYYFFLPFLLHSGYHLFSINIPIPNL